MERIPASASAKASNLVKRKDSMKLRFLRFGLALFVATALLAPHAIAADLTDIGFIDQAQVGSLPAFVDANRKLAQYKQGLDAQFAARIKAAKSDSERQTISLEFQQKFNDRQQELVGPIFARAQLAIANVSATKKLSIVVDKRIIVYGGVDITKDVIGLLQGGQAIAQPSATPPPSEIGFVDQSAIDNVPKIQKANADFQKFVTDTQKVYQQKFAAAKDDAAKKAVAADYDKVVKAKQKEMVQPVLDGLKAANASIAQKKNLLLIIDQGDVVYGGMNITQDVQNELGK